MTDTINSTADQAAEEAAAQAATQAADNASATAASERALKAAREAGSKALAALTELTQSVREQATALAERMRPQIATAAGYAKEQPARTLLASAALGAAVVGLYALLTRSGDRNIFTQRPSLKTQIGDAAADAFDAARDGVTDTVDSLRDKAAAASERLRLPLDAATSYAQEDPLKAVVIAAVAGALAMALIAAVVSSQRDD